MVARKIALTTRVFEKAGDGTAFFKEMLNRYQIGDAVSAVDAKDLDALMERHDERDEKIGVGVDHYEVQRGPEGMTRCFWIVRTDGSRIDISYLHCLKARPYD